MNEVVRLEVNKMKVGDRGWMEFELRKKSFSSIKRKFSEVELIEITSPGNKRLFKRLDNGKIFEYDPSKRYLGFIVYRSKNDVIRQLEIYAETEFENVKRRYVNNQLEIIKLRGRK